MPRRALCCRITLLFATLALAGGSPAGQRGPTFEVLWVWSGAVTPTSVVIKTKVRGSSSDLHLLLATDERLTAAQRFPLEGAASKDATGVAVFELTRLTPNTRYFYSVADGATRTVPGEFTTFAAGPMSFTFAAASCAGGNMFSHVSNHPIFNTIEDRRPLFFLHMGDFHYLNISRNDLQQFRRAFDLVLGQRRQASLYRHTPVVYMWDDHDYGPNDSDATSPARDAARAAYAQNVPHYPLAMDDDKVGTIQQEFTVGRVRFIVSDLRSERDRIEKPDGPEKSLLGLAQRAWLDQAFARAAAEGSPLVFWVNSVPWITRTGSREDGWQPFAWERQWLADRLEAHGLAGRLVMLSGDAHMVALDDGTNSNYATNAAKGARGFPVLHAAPLDRSAAAKGGPYSHGQSVENNQFGWVDVRDDGQDLRVTLTGHDAAGRQLRGMRLQLRCREGACAIDGTSDPRRSSVPDRP